MTGATTFRYVAHWQTDLPDEAEAVLAFWKRENALGDASKAHERVKEIVLHARNDADEIAGVCPVVPVTLPRLGQPMYYYRCFIGRSARSTRLALRMLDRAFEILEGHACKHDYPCIGVVLELENDGFKRRWRMAVWPWNDFVYVGKSGRGLDLRLRYFKGAKLKPPAKA